MVVAAKQESHRVSGTATTYSNLFIVHKSVVEGQTCRRAKDADNKFCLGKRCQQQPSANHICNHTNGYEQD